jgi:membrane protein
LNSVFAASTLTKQIRSGRVLSKGDMKLGGAFLASLLLAIWSTNGGVKAIIDALNVVYDEREKRGSSS